MKGKLFFYLIIGWSLVIFLAGCGTNHKTETVNVFEEMNLASDLSDMVNDADFIVLGSYEDFDKTWNVKRDPDDITKESETQYAEGNLYNFKIDEVLKGETDNETIKVSHTHTNNLEDEEDEASADVGNAEYEDPTFIEPNFEDQYILFLAKDEKLNLYTSPIEPNIIKFEDDIAHLETNLLDQGTFSQEIDLDDGTTVNIETEVGELDESLDDSISGEELKDIKKEIKKVAEE